jgi:hypothetical protein
MPVGRQSTQAGIAGLLQNTHHGEQLSGLAMVGVDLFQHGLSLSGDGGVFLHAWVGRHEKTCGVRVKRGNDSLQRVVGHRLGWQKVRIGVEEAAVVGLGLCHAGVCDVLMRRWCEHTGRVDRGQGMVL